MSTTIKDYNTLLVEASETGQLDTVKECLEHETDVNHVHEGKTALHAAAENDHLEIAHLLLARKADVNICDQLGWRAPPLHWASVQGDLDFVRLLLSSGAEVNATSGLRAATALMVAASNGHRLLVQHLVKAGANVNYNNQFNQTALSDALVNGCSELAEWLLENGAVFSVPSAFLQVVQRGRLQGVRMLAGRGREDIINAIYEDTTPLIEAVKIGNVAVVQELLTAGAKVNQSNGANLTPVIVAIIRNNLELVDILLLNDADPNMAVLDGSTPLQHALRSNNVEMVKMLMKYGAEPEENAMREALGLEDLEMLRCLLESKSANLTPLSSKLSNFIKQKKWVLVEFLIEHGMEVDVEDEKGCVPLNMAVQLQNSELVQKLVEKGAKPGGEALVVAARNSHLQLFHYLVEKGAKVEDVEREIGEIARGNFDLGFYLRGYREERVRMAAAAQLGGGHEEAPGQQVYED